MVYVYDDFVGVGVWFMFKINVHIWCMLTVLVLVALVMGAFNS